MVSMEYVWSKCRVSVEYVWGKYGVSMEYLIIRSNLPDAV